MPGRCRTFVETVLASRSPGMQSGLAHMAASHMLTYGIVALGAQVAKYVGVLGAGLVGFVPSRPAVVRVRVCAPALRPRRAESQ